ncbi:hypothetical protein BDZ94DRAFT_1321210 [Collybia nuda]|uniref:Uncharacterized protein n=1 Tax=Collybia nuda TaxID=64659 RepID=A0A9P5YAI9_9AGAR|nr:hypothetical protein BDZ94DRAFT_1321210 [Collybia nuda]
MPWAQPLLTALQLVVFSLLVADTSYRTLSLWREELEVENCAMNIRGDTCISRLNDEKNSLGHPTNTDGDQTKIEMVPTISKYSVTEQSQKPLRSTNSWPSKSALDAGRDESTLPATLVETGARGISLTPVVTPTQTPPATDIEDQLTQPSMSSSRQILSTPDTEDEPMTTVVYTYTQTLSIPDVDEEFGEESIWTQTTKTPPILDVKKETTTIPVAISTTVLSIPDIASERIQTGHIPSMSGIDVETTSVPDISTPVLPVLDTKDELIQTPGVTAPTQTLPIPNLEDLEDEATPNVVTTLTQTFSIPDVYEPTLTLAIPDIAEGESMLTPTLTYRPTLTIPNIAEDESMLTPTPTHTPTLSFPDMEEYEPTLTVITWPQELYPSQYTLGQMIERLISPCAVFVAVMYPTYYLWINGMLRL